MIIEAAWLQRVKEATLLLYELPSASFELFDQSAGYWIARGKVVPLGTFPISDLPAAITERGAEFRAVERLWELHDAVARSTLDYSIIRMRNAQVGEATRASSSF